MNVRIFANDSKIRESLSASQEKRLNQARECFEDGMVTYRKMTRMLRMNPEVEGWGRHEPEPQVARYRSYQFSFQRRLRDVKRSMYYSAGTELSHTSAQLSTLAEELDAEGRSELERVARMAEGLSLKWLRRSQEFEDVPVGSYL